MPETHPEDHLPASSRWHGFPAFTGHCNRYLLQVPREKIGYVNAILESYDWIARLRTAEIGEGILDICVPGDWDAVFQSAVGKLSQEIFCVFRGWERGMPRAAWGMEPENPAQTAR